MIIIAAGLSDPGWSEKRELYSTSLKFQSDLRTAQHMAVLCGYRYGVKFYCEQGYYHYRMGKFVDKDGKGKNFVFEEYTAEEPVYLGKDIETSLDSIYYTERGTPYGVGTITLKLGQYGQDITINPTGGRVGIKPAKKIE